MSPAIKLRYIVPNAAHPAVPRKNGAASRMCMTEGLRVASFAPNVTRQLPAPDRNSPHPLTQETLILSDTTPLDAWGHY